MTQLYVVGGQQRHLRKLQVGDDDWHGYHKGMILRVDSTTGRSELCAEYTSPPEVCPDNDPEIVFQASAVQGDRFYTCTPTEVLIYALPSFDLVGYVSLPCFNDVHHVRPTASGTILVANAGLDMILEITPDGRICQVYNVVGEDPWARFSPDVDYRRVESTKPHQSHPNYISMLDGEVWVTRFRQGDTMCLADPERRISISTDRIHDGVEHEGRLYFTTVNGTIVVANPQTLQVEDIIDLGTMHPEGTLLGWCRGVMLEDNEMWVGFSRIRPTKTRENVTWLLRGFKRMQGTHVACYDLAERRLLADIDLEQAGLNTIFSVFPATD
ncbi:MAG: hypothetical protein U0822_14535 [Anaerolineae bacterium]